MLIVPPLDRPLGHGSPLCGTPDHLALKGGPKKKLIEVSGVFEVGYDLVPFAAAPKLPPRS